MMSLKEYAPINQACLADYLPWALMVAPGVIEHKDGALQKTFGFRGHDLDSATPHDLMATSALFNNAIRRLGDGWTIFVEAQRNALNDYPKSSWPNQAAQAIDEERKISFNRAGNYFKNDYFLTLVFKQPEKISRRGAGWFLNKAPAQQSENDNLEIFQKAIQEMTGLLSGLLPLFRELDDDETLSYLHSTISSKRHKISTPDIPMYLDHILSDEGIEHGLELKVGDNFVRTLSIKGFPSESFPGMLDAINDLNFPFRWSTRFISMGPDTGKAHIDNIRRVWYAGRKRIGTILKEVASQSESGLGESSSIRKSEDADEASQLLDEGVVSFGFFTATISVWGPDSKSVDDKIHQVASVINRLGFSCHLETLNSFEAWLSSIPGHLYANVRKPVIHTLNLSHMVPLSAIWAGEESNAHLKGPPHFVAQCRGHTPFRFSTNVGDVGHTLIFGPTGAGKSTLLSFMAVQWLRYKRAQVFIFDKGSSSRVITECVGGSFFSVGAKSTGLCFQPLKNILNEAERIWASEWLGELLEDQGCQLSTEIRLELWQALLSLSEHEPQMRTLSVLKSLVQEDKIRQALEPFTLAGPYGYLFDASEELSDNNYWQVFETGELFEQKTAIKPALSYLFHRLAKCFDGRPTLLVLDEAWLFLEDSSFAKKIKQWLKELRKSNVYVIFATQSLADAMQSSIAIALKESCLTKIFLPNASAQDESSAEFYRAIGLNERQINIIARAIPKREYYLSSPVGNRLFDLALGPVALALCASSSINDQKLVSNIKHNHGHQNFWHQFLQTKGIVHETSNSLI
jgi:type IV secretion/conjugal transfer VirB4 family ATPase